MTYRIKHDCFGRANSGQAILLIEGDMYFGEPSDSMVGLQDASGPIVALAHDVELCDAPPTVMPTPEEIQVRVNESFEEQLASLHALQQRYADERIADYCRMRDRMDAMETRAFEIGLIGMLNECGVQARAL